MSFKNAPRLSESTIKAQAQAVSRAKKNEEVKEKDVHEDMGSKELPAKYKIEVFFGPKRTIHGPNPVKVSFWESGRRLHGGGDDLMYICRDSEDEAGCNTIFASDCVKGPIAVCPSCQQMIYAERLTRALKGYKTSKDLATELSKFFRQLGSNADIYCKYDRTDIRYVSVEKAMGSAKARELRGKSIYPLKNIINDTANGASLEGRILAFLTA
jgi:hypothetical protein